MLVKARLNLNRCKEVQFYCLDSHDCFLTLAKQSRKLAERALYLAKARRCRQGYLNVGEFVRHATGGAHVAHY